MRTRTVEAYRMPVAERVFSYLSELAVIQENSSGKAQTDCDARRQVEEPEAALRIGVLAACRDS